MNFIESKHFFFVSSVSQTSHLDLLDSTCKTSTIQTEKPTA